MSSKKSDKKLIVANWKMNPKTLTEAKKIFSALRRKKITYTNTTPVICPPYIYLNELARLGSGSKFFFGAQDIFWEQEGSFTGEISTKMIQNLGARFVIIGHSERRALGETDVVVNQKLRTALQSGLHTILCVGETTRDSSGVYLRYIQEQLHMSLEAITKKEVEKLVIAYEPVWAIGKGHRPPETHEIHQMVLFIKKVLIKKYGKKIAMEVPILYGGSTDADNAHEIVHEGGVDGLLVGRSSLHPQVFGDMVSEVARKPKTQ